MLFLMSTPSYALPTSTHCLVSLSSQEEESESGQVLVTVIVAEDRRASLTRLLWTLWAQEAMRPTQQQQQQQEPL